jgi:hypothetical protein
MDKNNVRAPFVVIREFKVKPKTMSAFLTAAKDDASHSVVEEPGCRQFNVVGAENRQDPVVFYEVISITARQSWNCVDLTAGNSRVFVRSVLI